MEPSASSSLEAPARSSGERRDGGISVTAGNVGKRTLDIVVSGGALVALSPLLLVCAILVRLDSPGPVLFGHARCGKEGRMFRCLKFRTMENNAPNRVQEEGDLREHYVGNGFKIPRKSDPRVTRLGHLLRWTHLDELPQLLNVLRGDMSLVGPRPIVRDELELYGDRGIELLSVRPGIFGAWTAMGKERPNYPERIDVELGYVRNRGFWSDLRLLVRNVPVLLWGQTDE